jgi:predicted transcriptional regulator
MGKQYKRKSGRKGKKLPTIEMPMENTNSAGAELNIGNLNKMVNKVLPTVMNIKPKKGSLLEIITEMCGVNFSVATKILNYGVEKKMWYATKKHHYQITQRGLYQVREQEGRGWQ